MSVPGKRSRVKNWVAGQQIDSFSDLEGDDGSSEDGSDDGQSQAGVNGREVNGRGHAKEEGRYPDPSQDWENFEETARKCISSTKTSIRLAFLNKALIKNLKNESLTPQQTAAVFKILVPTYSRYVDRPSRDAVQECVKLIITIDLQKQSGKLSEAAVKWLETEVTTKVCSPTSFAAGTTIVNLLAWIATVFDAHAKTLGTEGFGKDHKNWQPLLRSMAICYDASQIATLREPVRKSGTMNMRRTVRQNAVLIPDLLKTLHIPSSIKPPTATAALLGLVIDVSVRIKKTRMVDVARSMAWVQAEKAAILAYYREHILASRTPLLPHITTAFNDFVASFVQPEDLALESELVKAMDRALLRSPEVALTTLDVFFTTYTSPTPLAHGRNRMQLPPTELVNKKLLPQILSAAKSSNALVRSSSALLYNTLVSSLLLDPASAATVLAMAREAALPLRTNKSASPEHRITLSQMLLSTLSSNEPSIEIAYEVAESIVAALAKEANEAALQASLNALISAMLVLLEADQTQKVQPSVTVLAKGAKDTKVNTRRCYLAATGEMFWRLSRQVKEPNASEQELVKAILPALEAAIKTASTVTAGSAVEGWIATAVLKAVLSRWKIAQVDALLQKDPILQNILSHSPKPSFLLAERAYKKLANNEDEIWLVRALESTLLAATSQLAGSDPSSRIVASLPLLHVALESSQNEHRKDALRAIENIARRECEIERQDQLAVAASEEHRVPDRSSRLQALLLSLARAAVGQTSAIARFIVLAHHDAIAATRPSLWVDLAIAASCDPAGVAASESSEILAQIAIAENHETATFVQAAYKAISTVVFVAPDTYLPIFIDKIRRGVDVASLKFVGDVEMGILESPEDMPFVDVLANSKGAATTTSKGKNAAIDKWDEETRKALEAKKRSAGGAAVKLSKADQALVDEQLRKERDIRSRIVSVVAEIRKAFQTTQSLIKSGSTQLLRSFIPVILSPILAASLVPQAQLYSEEAFQTILRLYESCSDRISDIRLSLSLAVLRGARSIVVPAEFDVEELSVLATRVLYRLRFQSEREAFDPSTYALAAPLLHRCIQEEGTGVSKGDNDASMEQLALAIDVILFHANKFKDPSYPRLETIQALVLAIAKYPSLSQPASTALQDLGAAIDTNAAQTEISAFLQSMMAEEVQVRHACLQALTPLDLTDLDYTPELWIVCQDTDERNADLANTVWEDNGLDTKDNAIDTLAPFLDHKTAFVRASAAMAIAKAVEQVPTLISEALSRIARDYQEAAKERLPEYDRFGMLIEASLDQEDPWKARSAHAEALQHLAQYYAPEQVEQLFRLLVADQALGDRSEQVRSKMLDAGIATIDAQGKANLQPLMTQFQDYLGSQSASNEVGDRVTESVIVLLGRLARHLDSSDSRVGDVIDRLMVALKTPSEIVQFAVSDCLPPLVRANATRGAKVIEQLLRETLQASRYAERRGAAYGLAGAVKGRGITSMKEFDIMTRLQDAAEDKKNQNARQGAMFAFETLSSTLGRLFEPYIIKILPLLLICLGDTSTDVRDATTDAAKVIMSRVSGHAVKQILPVLLDALQERQWRTKKGAIELMGAMAYLAPRQLSRSLPTIIPPLTEVLTDTHTQVRTSANASLKKFGEVVDNPEIQAMQSILLAALVDPTKKTGKALDTLLTTSFVHYIDTSSLALIVPIIDRGLRERSTELKRKGAQIVGNMASLTDSKDLIPYLPQLIPRVREVLIDPVPEARATAAKSLGVLIERLGENAFPTLVDDLSDILHSDVSGVDQQGAAQGLAEVLSGLGVERMESMLPAIIASTSSSRAYVREGYISLLIYLPSVFGDRFSPYLGRIIQPVLGGLADDSDFVREASMRAGRMIVNNHATKAIDLLLPELERGLFDHSWRIRLSSIQLIGELLFRISGISGKAEMEQEGNEEEDDAYTSNAEAAKKMLEVLGKDRRDRVLASLYILRQDSAGQVRMFSLNVWKALVTNTPRTVRDILSSLMHTIIRLLASSEGEQREMTARTLGELCRKQGDRVLGEIIPILQRASQGNEGARQGCCLAFAEILETSTKAQLEGHEDDIINSVRGALVDDSPAVRQAAAQAFDALQTQIGPRSIDQTIPTLLAALTQAGSASEAALSALKELMAVRAQAIFPILIPTLIATPISAFNAQALGSLVGVAGSALNRRLAQILDALQSNKESQTDPDIKSELEATIKAVLGSVEDVEGLHMLMLHLLGLAKDPRVPKRIGGCELFATFCQTTEEDFSAYHIDWLRRILALYEDGEDKVVAAAIDAMEALSKTLTKEHMEGLAPALRRTVETTSSAGNDIAGFCRPGGLKPVLPILIQGLLAGTNEQREQSAYGLGDIVERTATDSLKPHVTQITGPLIRIIAERYPPPVKAAILSTLAVLLTKAPQFVRPFFPQLQRTFVKNLSELSSSTIRQKAAHGLGILMSLQPRIDPLITELVNGCSHDEQEVRDAMSNALGQVLRSGGANMTPPARSAVAGLVRATLEEPGKEAFNNGIARTLAGMLLHSMDEAEPLVQMLLEGKATPLSSVSILECLETAPSQLYGHNSSRIISRILKNVVNEHPGVARPAREARELLKKTQPWSEDEDVHTRLA